MPAPTCAALQSLRVLCVALANHFCFSRVGRGLLRALLCFFSCHFKYISAQSHCARISPTDTFDFFEIRSKITQMASACAANPLCGMFDFFTCPHWNKYEGIATHGGDSKENTKNRVHAQISNLSYRTVLNALPVVIALSHFLPQAPTQGAHSSRRESNIQHLPFDSTNRDSLTIPSPHLVILPPPSNIPRTRPSDPHTSTVVTHHLLSPQPRVLPPPFLHRFSPPPVHVYCSHKKPLPAGHPHCSSSRHLPYHHCPIITALLICTLCPQHNSISRSIPAHATPTFHYEYLAFRNILMSQKFCLPPTQSQLRPTPLYLLLIIQRCFAQDVTIFSRQLFSLPLKSKLQLPAHAQCSLHVCYDCTTASR